MVQTPCHPQGMPISDAIALSNLEVFIKGEKWFEMLPSLYLSQTGKHFILLEACQLMKPFLLWYLRR